LIHRVGKDMRRRNEGRILITGSIAGFTPGSFQAVYNATKSYLNSFSFALREELRDTKVTVTCLMPGATETEFVAARTCSIPKSDPKTKMTPPWSPAWALRR
jgi:short-subunit dehydrogenase